MAEKEEGEKTIATDIVVTKYKMAGEMVNRKLPFNPFPFTRVPFRGDKHRFVR